MLNTNDEPDLNETFKSLKFMCAGRLASMPKDRIALK